MGKMYKSGAPGVHGTKSEARTMVLLGLGLSGNSSMGGTVFTLLHLIVSAIPVLKQQEQG